MQTTFDPATETDRVRRYTSPEMLHRIEEQIERNVAFYSAQSNEAITRRIEQLQQEWSINRYLQLNVASAGFLSATLALIWKEELGICHGGRIYLFPFPWDPRLGPANPAPTTNGCANPQ